MSDGISDCEQGYYEKPKHIRVSLGGLVEPLEKQLKDQNLKYDVEEVKIFQTLNDSIFELCLSDILKYSEVEKARLKLHKLILAHIKKKNKLVSVAKAKE